MTADRMRALHLIANLDRGGGQEVVRTLVRNLRDFGVDPLVVSFRDGPLRGEIEAEGIPVEVVPGRTRSVTDGPGAVLELWRIQRALRSIVRTHSIDIIQTHLLRSLDFLALSLRREPTVRAVFWTVHNAMLELREDQLPRHGWLLGAKRIVHRTMYRAGGRVGDGFIAVSSDVAAAVQTVYRPPEGKLTTIANGVDVRRYGMHVDRAEMWRALGVPTGALVAIVVAKLMEQKGHAVLLDALTSLRGEVPNLHTVLVGEGELRPSLEARVLELGLTERVTFTGNRADIPRMLAGSDLFLLPSLWEGLPMALLEAMASRLPVIATAVSGTREVVEDGKSGILVPPRDVAALHAAVVRLARDPAGARSLAAAARARVEDCYSARSQAQRHAELYRTRLTASRGGRV